MHFTSVVLVCGVHCVMPKGRPTAGMVLANFSDPSSPCMRAEILVLAAVPVRGCTFFTRPTYWLLPSNCCTIKSKIFAMAMYCIFIIIYRWSRSEAVLTRTYAGKLKGTCLIQYRQLKSGFQVLNPHPLLYLFT